MEHLKNFQTIYAVFAIIFGLGVLSTQVMTKEAHADDMASQKEANLEILRIMDERFKVEAKKDALVRVENRINKLLDKEHLSPHDQSDLRALQKEQDLLLEAIHGS